MQILRINGLPRLLSALLACLAASLALAVPARAEVDVHFHSLNGSIFFGRYPHTFIVFEGRLDSGQRIEENFGFSAVSTSEAMTNGPARHKFLLEDAESIADSNHHFTITVSDAKYREMRAEVDRWRNHTGRLYDLNDNNCIHFVAKMAEMAGLRVAVPDTYLRRPKAWLNYITRHNPQLGVQEVD